MTASILFRHEKIKLYLSLLHSLDIPLELGTLCDRYVHVICLSSVDSRNCKCKMSRMETFVLQ